MIISNLGYLPIGKTTVWDMCNMKLERSLAVANALIPLQIQRLGICFSKNSTKFCLVVAKRTSYYSAVLKQGRT